MTNDRSQNVDLQTTETGFQYHRGSALSIFKSDRREDLVALVCALLIALGVWAHVNLGWGIFTWLGLK
ncbi:MAG: hypothetical protein KDJ41_13990 [Hyphomicrobiaceae bacterium]|nr:hypothetical protein [Hyphomicrobiaceae bacterium]